MIRFEDHVDHFKSTITDSWLTPRGVTFSEAFALSAAIKDLQIELMMESGVAFGGSTELMAQLCDSVPLFGMDTFTTYPESYKYSIERLAPYSHVRIVQGNAWTEIPRFLEFVHKVHGYLPPLGLFIDGPKGGEALDLAITVVQNIQELKFLALHDVKVDSEEAQVLRDFWPQTLFWDDPNAPFASIREEIDNHMLELNKDRASPTLSSLDRAAGAGYLQTAMTGSPRGHGLALIELHNDGIE